MRCPIVLRALRTCCIPVFMFGSIACSEPPNAAVQPQQPPPAMNAGAPAGQPAPAPSAGASGQPNTGGQSGAPSAGSPAPMRPPPTNEPLPPLADAGTPQSDASTPAPIACPATPLAAGDHRESLRHGDRDRAFIVHVPPGIAAGEPRPLVVDFHGYSSSAAGQQRASGWQAIADRAKFIAVYPDGIGNSWNVGDNCCGTAGTQNVDDIGFVRALVAHVAGEVCIDPARIYASGISNGGGFAHRLGCEAADLFAAVAPVATDLRTQPCRPARPISVIAFRGTADFLEPYEGGEIGPPGMTFTSPGAKGSLELWRMISGCTGTPAMTETYCETYQQCAQGVEVTLCTLPNVGHVPYDNPLDFDVADASWKMFERQPKR